MFGTIGLSVASLCVLGFLVWRTVPLLNELKVTWREQRDLF